MAVTSKAPAARLSIQARDNLAGFLFIAPWLVHFVFLIAGAMVFSMGISFFKTDFLTGFEFVGFENWREMFRDELFWKALRVTSYYTFVLVPANVILALTIAVLMNLKVKALGIWRTVYYLPSVVQGVAVAVLWGYVLNPRFGLLNQGLQLIGIDDGPRWLYSEEWAVPGFILMGLWGAGGAMLLYLAGLQGIPTHLYEAADLDGAGPVRKFFAVTIPMLTPTIYFNVLISIIGSFQVFTQALILTAGGPNNATLTLVLLLYREGFQNFQFGYASAIAWGLFCVTFIFAILVVRTSGTWVHYEGDTNN